MKIIGITGLNGSGKGIVGEFLPKFFQQGVAEYISVSDKVAEMLGSSYSRDDLALMANKKRQEFGGDYWLKEIIKKHHKPVLVIESIRSPDEVSLIHNEGGILISIMSPDKIRYLRVKNRNQQKDINFTKSFEDFISQENFENNNTENWKQNVPYCIQHSDFTLENNDFFEDKELARQSKSQLIRDTLDLIDPFVFEKFPEFKKFYYPPRL